MPEMDGLAATAAIRAKEQATGGHVPIIAMTAYAMKDRERCLRQAWMAISPSRFTRKSFTLRSNKSPEQIADGHGAASRRRGGGVL